MKCINRVTILGLLGRDVEVRYLPSGLAIADMSVATNRSYKSGEEWKTETEWHRITAFGRAAEQCAENVRKGDAIFIEGRLQTQVYEKDGDKKWVTKIIAEDVSFLKRGGESKKQAKDETDDYVPF